MKIIKLVTTFRVEAIFDYRHPDEVILVDLETEDVKEEILRHTY